MNDATNELKAVIEKHLKAKGLASDQIESFLRDLDRVLMERNEPLQVTARLHLLGWNDFDVDYRTMELAEAYFDSNKAVSELH